MHWEGLHRSRTRHPYSYLLAPPLTLPLNPTLTPDQVKDEQGRKERQLKHAKRAAEAKKKARAEPKVEPFLP